MLLGLVSLVGNAYTWCLMPIFADQILHGGARGLGILMGATGVGALFGALTLAFRRGRERPGALGGMVLRRFRRQSGGVRALAQVLAFRAAAAAGGLLHDAADGLLRTR